MTFTLRPPFNRMSVGACPQSFLLQVGYAMTDNVEFYSMLLSTMSAGVCCNIISWFWMFRTSSRKLQNSRLIVQVQWNYIRHSQKNERRNLFTVFEKGLFLLHTVRCGRTTRTDPRGAEATFNYRHYYN